MILLGISNLFIDLLESWTRRAGPSFHGLHHTIEPDKGACCDPTHGISPWFRGHHGHPQNHDEPADAKSTSEANFFEGGCPCRRPTAQSWREL